MMEKALCRGYRNRAVWRERSAAAAHAAFGEALLVGHRIALAGNLGMVSSEGPIIHCRLSAALVPGMLLFGAGGSSGTDGRNRE